MIRRCWYELGLSGRGPSLIAEDLDAITVAARHLPPGRYWATVTEELHDDPPAPSRRETEDWGVLEVTDRVWTLRTMDGEVEATGLVGR